MNYYNENDPRCVAWLKALIAADAIPAGDVDDRSIENVRPADLEGYHQCHFFAGIGGWPLALALAGVDPEWPVWTGSVPCQPFSQAGRRDGYDDPRHLWPAFYWLIHQCNPAVVFGEQVASPAGRAWLAGVSAEMEVLGYSTGAADLCAASIGAPHIRQRLYWVAESCGKREQLHLRSRKSREDQLETGGRSEDCGMADPDCEGKGRWRIQGPNESTTESAGTSLERPTGLRQDIRVGSARRAGTGGYPRAALGEEEERYEEWQQPWDLSDCTLIAGADGKYRRIKSGLKPLVNGLPGRLGLLRGYGNAIVPQVAAEFIGAYLECI